MLSAVCEALPHNRRLVTVLAVDLDQRAPSFGEAAGSTGAEAVDGASRKKTNKQTNNRKKIIMYNNVFFSHFKQKNRHNSFISLSNSRFLWLGLWTAELIYSHAWAHLRRPHGRFKAERRANVYSLSEPTAFAFTYRHETAYDPNSCVFSYILWLLRHQERGLWLLYVRFEQWGCLCE